MVLVKTEFYLHELPVKVRQDALRAVALTEMFRQHVVREVIQIATDYLMLACPNSYKAFRVGLSVNVSEYGIPEITFRFLNVFLDNDPLIRCFLNDVLGKKRYFVGEFYSVVVEGDLQRVDVEVDADIQMPVIESFQNRIGDWFDKLIYVVADHVVRGTKYLTKLPSVADWVVDKRLLFDVDGNMVGVGGGW